MPLYTETKGFRWTKRVLVIDVSQGTQLARLQKRDNINHQLAQKMLDSQASREQRLAIADDVINNEGSLQDLHNHCLQLHQKYLTFLSFLT